MQEEKVQVGDRTEQLQKEEKVMEHLLYGAAYYEEYLPEDRLEKDVQMMKAAGINVVRIAESTWSTCEPQEGVFDFSHVERVLDAMEGAGISVIVGTPTYAVPTWMVKSYPDVLATTQKGRGIYGPRQIMDITNPVYLFYAERVIRKLMECTAHRKCVIGFQLDNETKYYGTAGKNVQRGFVKYLRKKFHDDLDAMNHEFGLDYWSNRINAWEDFPDVRGTINASLGAEFQKYQRTLVDHFLEWQAGIVGEYKREDQFVTHNFDFEWRGHSFGVQPEVNHFHAARPLTTAGVDIYHPTQDQLTGTEIAFGGDMTRSLKQDNYLVLETEAQGFPCWTPYPGQLRLQAYSHLASGANSVMYWHWHSLHNACETYWKGLLSHDFRENAPYREAKRIGQEFARLSPRLVNLKKTNRTAILVSNEALTALEWFPVGQTENGKKPETYNDMVRWLYDALYRMNIECDFVFPDSENLEEYRWILVPALYAAPEELLHRLNRFVEQGGHLLVTFKSAFADENCKVRHEMQPHILNRCLGVTYQQFTWPGNVYLTGELFDGRKEERQVRVFMELLQPAGAQVLASYDHPAWKEYAAVTRNRFGKGTAVYLGCGMSCKMLERLLDDCAGEAGIERSDCTFPVIVRKGISQNGTMLRYFLNYSSETQKIYVPEDAEELLTETLWKKGEAKELEPWGVAVAESRRDR